ncbi:hypothetical protein NQZ68_016272 [Dissostichus eleginoides]|nr:hypothetical protein NQZ68_016272 [Dissostichus eleginoides]
MARPPNYPLDLLWESNSFTRDLQSEFSCLCFDAILNKSTLLLVVSIATVPTHVFRILCNAGSEEELQ